MASSRGTVSVEGAGAKRMAAVSDKLNTGDTVTTAAASTADISATAGGKQVSVIHVWESSSYSIVSTTVDDDNSVKASAKLNSGSASGAFTATAGDSALVLEAGPSQGEVHGSFLARADGAFYCYDGRIAVTHSGQTFNLLPGQYFDPGTTSVLPHSLPQPVFVANLSQPFVQVVSPTQVASPTGPTQGSSGR